MVSTGAKMFRRIARTVSYVSDQRSGVGCATLSAIWIGFALAFVFCLVVVSGAVSLVLMIASRAVFVRIGDNEGSETSSSSVFVVMRSFLVEGIPRGGDAYANVDISWTRRVADEDEPAVIGKSLGCLDGSSLSSRDELRRIRFREERRRGVFNFIVGGGEERGEEDMESQK